MDGLSSSEPGTASILVVQSLCKQFSKLLDIMLMTLLAEIFVPAREKTWLQAAVQPFIAVTI